MEKPAYLKNYSDIRWTAQVNDTTIKIQDILF
jgi:hypothetical protein